MKKYKLSNKTMFAIVMRDEELCKEFIERLFPDRKVRKIHFPESDEQGIKLTGFDDGVPDSLRDLIQGSIETEKSIINGIKSKSVRLDVLFEDSDTLYDVEMQVETEEHLAKRSRYYHSAMSVNSLKRGQEYGSLKNSYVIFICMYDPFKRGEAIYQFEMFDPNLDLQLNDGAYTIVVNTKCPKGNIPKELESFYAYVETADVDESDRFIKKLDERVTKVNDDEEVSGVMTLEEELNIRYNSGLRKGEQIGLQRGAAQKEREIAKNLKASGISPEIIAKNTGLTLEEVEAL